MTTLHEAMAARVERGDLPGIVTLVARGDHIEVDAIGTTGHASDEPMRRDTVFRIASMTKPVLAVATLMLAEDDLLDLEEPVHRLLPELAGQRVLARPDGPLDDTVPAERPPTVADLLTFRFGFGTIAEPEFNPPWPIVRAADDLQLVLGPPDPRTPWDPDGWMRRFATLPLMHQPGAKWQYNVGSLLLGVLVARAAGQPLDHVFKERVFEPLGMRETGFSLPLFRARELPAHYPAAGAAENTGTGPDVWSREPLFPSGAGGLVSTADDFWRFARFLLDRGVHGGTRLLSEHAVELMTTNRLTPEQVATAGPLLGGAGWGYGVAVQLTDDLPRHAGLYGWSGGYGTSWFNDPAEDLAAILLTQVSDVLWNGTVDEFQRLAYA